MHRAQKTGLGAWTLTTAGPRLWWPHGSVGGLTHAGLACPCGVAVASKARVTASIGTSLGRDSSRKCGMPALAQSLCQTTVAHTRTPALTHAPPATHCESWWEEGSSDRRSHTSGAIAEPLHSPAAKGSHRVLNARSEADTELVVRCRQLLALLLRGPSQRHTRARLCRHNQLSLCVPSSVWR